MFRACCDCGERKPVSKFFNDQPRCKACRIGVTALNRQRAATVLERRDGEPTEDEIAAACESIRARWSRLKMEARKRKAVSL